MAQMSRRARVVLVFFLTGGVLLGGGCAVFQHQKYDSLSAKTPLPADSYLIIGFMAGREPWNEYNRPIGNFVRKLRAMNLPNVQAETIENSKMDIAMRLVREAYDRNRDGRLDEQERASVRLILYGHSLGGTTVVEFARLLKKEGIPVLLTAQIDSPGATDGVIPSNVVRAINFYQHNSRLLRGHSQIRAEDPQKTTILGSYTYDYSRKDVNATSYIWPIKILGGAHVKVASDPDVWARIEALVMKEINHQPETTAGSNRQ